MVVVQGGGQWHCQRRNTVAMLRNGGGNQSEQWMDGRRVGAVMEDDAGVNFSPSCLDLVGKQEKNNTVKLALTPINILSSHFRLMAS